MSDIDFAFLASIEVLARARKIELFLMDVDGTLADGGVCLISPVAANGSTDPIASELKVFNAQDRLWRAGAVKVFRSNSISFPRSGFERFGQTADGINGAFRVVAPARR